MSFGPSATPCCMFHSKNTGYLPNAGAPTEVAASSRRVPAPPSKSGLAPCAARCAPPALAAQRQPRRWTASAGPPMRLKAERRTRREASRRTRRSSRPSARRWGAPPVTVTHQLAGIADVTRHARKNTVSVSFRRMPVTSKLGQFVPSLGSCRGRLQRRQRGRARTKRDPRRPSSAACRRHLSHFLRVLGRRRPSSRRASCTCRCCRSGLGTEVGCRTSSRNDRRSGTLAHSNRQLPHW